LVQSAYAGTKTNAVVHMRQPFKVTLQVDANEVYELVVTNETPFVLQNNVFVLPNDSFGVSVSNAADGTIAIRYEPDKRKSDLTFTLKQHVPQEGDPITILTTQNKLDQALRFQVFKELHNRDMPVYSGQVNAYPKIPVCTGIPGVVTSLSLFGFEFPEMPRMKEESNKPDARDGL
jgi:hypothetical protein